MALTINTNLSSMLVQMSLQQSTFDLNKAIERMTTGYKLNHASDNAANYSISSKYSSQISSMHQVMDNTDNGLSMLGMAQDGLSEMQNRLERLRALAMQASNGTYGATSLEAIQSEADSIIESIEQLRQTMEYNGITLYYNDEEDVPTPSSMLNTVNPLSLSLPKMQALSFSNEPEASVSNTDSDTELNDITSADDSTAPVSLKSNIRMLAKAPSNLLGATPTIDGSVSVAGGETQTITIDGVDYTVKNLQSTINSFSYSKDTSTGELTLICSYFEIRGQDNVAHNILVDGINNKVYGGSLDDIISDKSSTSVRNTYYGNGGNDVLTSLAMGTDLYGGNDDDILTANAAGDVYGDNGNDTITLNSGGSNNITAYGGSGNDNITVNRNSSTVYGGDGDDSFTITSNSNKIDGQSGTNTVISNTGTNNTIYNVEGSSTYCVTFKKSESKTLNINGINYDVKNLTTSSNDFIYDVDETTGKITFSGTSFEIKGELNKQHNVRINSSENYFYGGNLKDTISTAGTNYIFGLGGNDTITSTNRCYIDGGDGNDTITVSSYGNQIIGGAGDDKITLNGVDNIAVGGDGNDTIVNKGDRNSVSGGAGTNTLSGSKTPVLIEGFGTRDNSQIVTIAKKSTISLNISGKTYTIKNASKYVDSTVFYSHNDVTDEITFASANPDATNITITGENGKEHNIIAYGSRYRIYGGNQNDTIVSYAYNTYIYGGDGDDYLVSKSSSWSSLHGGNGNDTLVSNASHTSMSGGDGNDILIINSTARSDVGIKGEAGDDTYYINASCQTIDNEGNNVYYVNTNSTSVIGGEGNDTFNVTGNDNTVNGGAGNNYYIIDGDNTSVVGGADLNYVVDNGNATTLISAVVDPNAGILNLSASEEGSFSIGGKTYNVKNNLGTSNSLNYNYNENTGILTVNGSSFTIDSEDEMNINLRGDNNTVNGSSHDDKITVESGKNNIINGGEGNDTIQINSENNAVDGGAGNDNIKMNAASNKTVTGGAGDDTIEVASNGNTKIMGGAGNDTFMVSGENNKITAGEGDNKINITGEGNTITATNGNNKLVIDASNNTVTLGNGANSIGVQGNENTVTASNAVGNINIFGDGNTITTLRGESIVTIKGNENTFDSALGQKNIKIAGNSNNVTTGDNSDTMEIVGDNNVAQSSAGNNNIKISGNQNEYQGGTDIDTVSISGNGNIANGGDSSDKFYINSGDSNIVDGETGEKDTVYNKGTNSSITNAYEVTTQPRELAFKVDIGSGDDKFIHTTIDFDTMGFKVDLSSADSAQKSLADIDELMATINEQLTNIGSTINRMVSVQEAQSSKLNNLVSSLSTIRDADVAKESSAYIRAQILQQASATLLATANQSPSIALQLL